MLLCTHHGHSLHVYRMQSTAVHTSSPPLAEHMSCNGHVVTHAQTMPPHGRNMYWRRSICTATSTRSQHCSMQHMAKPCRCICNVQRVWLYVCVLGHVPHCSNCTWQPPRGSCIGWWQVKKSSLLCGFCGEPSCNCPVCTWRVDEKKGNPRRVVHTCWLQKKCGPLTLTPLAKQACVRTSLPCSIRTHPWHASHIGCQLCIVFCS